jgi:RNA polymerase sigma-70 factor (ECF subfamily)
MTETLRNDGGVLDDRAEVPPQDDGFGAELIHLRPFLMSRAVTLCRDASAAEDLVQETYRRALEGRHTFRSGSNLRGWLTTIMRNHFVDSWRRPAHEGFHDLEALALATCEETRPFGPLDILSPDDIWAVLGELSEQDRKIFELAYLQGVSHREIARQIPVRERTIATRLFRARAKIRVLLQRVCLARADRSPDLQDQELPRTRPRRGRSS